MATGYGRILSYSLPSSLQEEEVRNLALRHLAARGRKDRIRTARLVFVPFYRLTGLDFAWSWREKVITSPLLDLKTSPGPEPGFSPLRWGEEVLGESWGESLPPLKEKEYRLTSVYLDRTFLAADLPSLSLRSLGIRSQVLTLRLFDPRELSQEGEMIPVQMGWREAWDRGERDLPSGNLTRRQILNRILSLIFFPLWEVQIEGEEKLSSLIFDGVARSLLEEEAKAPFFPDSPPEENFAPQTLRFRPLSCPNCGGSLPVDAAFRLFSCPHCHRAWHIRGDDFEGISYRLAIPPQKTGRSLSAGKIRFLPFWIFLGEVVFEGRTIASKYDLGQIAPQARLATDQDKAVPLRFFIPAFKVRDLHVANRIATSFTRMQPLFQTQDPSGETLHPGGVLDREEAATFAHLALISIAPKGNPKLVERISRAELTLSQGELVFFPYLDHLNSLQEDFLGTAIHKNTLQ